MRCGAYDAMLFFFLFVQKDQSDDKWKHMVHVGNNICDKYMHPKRRFWTELQNMKSAFSRPFQVLSTRFGLRTIEKSIENARFIFCSDFQNLRLGTIK